MKPIPQIDPNVAGDEVKRLLAEDGTSNAELKDIRAAKATRKEQLKKALTIVWEALEAGQVVNGFATKEEWCANYAKVTIRHCQHIIFGRSKPEANNSSPERKAFIRDFGYDRSAKKLTLYVDTEVRAEDGTLVQDGTGVSFRAAVDGAKDTATLDAAIKKMKTLLKSFKLWNSEFKTHAKEVVNEWMTEHHIKEAKPAAPKVKMLTAQDTRDAIALACSKTRMRKLGANPRTVIA